jgi:hypothetical protein
MQSDAQLNQQLKTKKEEVLIIGKLVVVKSLRTLRNQALSIGNPSTILRRLKDKSKLER